MRKTLCLFGTFLMAAVILSCSKEVNDSAGQVLPQEIDTPVTESNFFLVASTDEITRTELGVDKYIYWKSGDALSVWEKDNSANANVKLELTAASEGETTGTFSGSLTPASSDFSLYAIYPYSSTYSADPSAVSISLPAAVEQQTSANGVVGVSDFMFGTTSFTSETTEYLMRFRYPLALLDIVVDGTGSCLSAATVESLTITANTAFVGNATVDLSAGTVTPADEDAGKSLVITYPSTAKMDAACHAWVAIYPVDLTNAACCFDLKMTNGQEIKFNVNPKRAFQEQTIYTINLTDIDTRVDAGKAKPVYYDLVAANSGARANCYIVSEGGYYRFAAQKVDKTNTFDGSSPYTDGYRANWLWSEGTSTLVDNVGIGNSGNINFRVKANARGNALIALFDPSSNIVWSWHIWMTESDALEPTHWSRNDAWLMADRNLGALSSEQGNVDSYGLYYQWGRKDPFPASNTVGQNSSSKESTSFNSSTKPYVCNPDYSVSFSSVRNSVAGATDEIAYSIAHPTTFIHYHTNNSTTAKTKTWFYKTSVETAVSLWNSSTNKNSKTNYDPCPPGWTIPVGNDYSWKGTNFTNYIAAETSETLSGLVYTRSTDNCSYYPACGYRSAGQLVNVGYVAYYWTAITNVSKNADDLSAYGLQYEGRGTKTSTSATLQTAYGLPVRCMKM